MKTTVIKEFTNARNYRLNKNGNSAIFFLYVCNGKKFKSCLHLFEMGVRCVSVTPVVLNAKLFDWLRRTWPKEDNGKQTNPKCRFLREGT